jgi:hypothetical protein
MKSPLLVFTTLTLSVALRFLPRHRRRQNSFDIRATFAVASIAIGANGACASLAQRWLAS